MFKSLIAWLVVHLNRKICTASQLSNACNKTIESCKKDKDGMISVAEALIMIAKFIKEMKE